MLPNLPRAPWRPALQARVAKTGIAQEEEELTRKALRNEAFAAAVKGTFLPDEPFAAAVKASFFPEASFPATVKHKNTIPEPFPAAAEHNTT